MKIDSGPIVGFPEPGTGTIPHLSFSIELNTGIA